MANNNNQLHAEIISPSGVIFDGYCSMVTIPGSSGDLGIMANHEPTLARLVEGKINIYEGDKITNNFEIVGGFAQNVENKILILLDK